MKITSIFIILCITILLFSCPPEDPPPEQDQYTIQGIIRSAMTGEVLSGCQVRVGSTTTQTGPDGAYVVQLEAIDTQEIVRFSKSGFTGSYKPLRYFSGTTLRLDGYLLPVDTVDIINPNPLDGNGNTIVTPDGASVHIPNIEGIEENLVVSLTNYSVGTDEILAVPGDFEGIAAGGAEATLISKGMITVDIRGETSGDEYSFGDGSYGNPSFDIVIPATADNLDVPPETPLVLWYFDEENGVWIEEEGVALNPYGDGFIATVDHFTTFNADFKMLERTCISGIIEDPDPASGAGYTIALSFDGFYREFYQTDDTFTVINLPRGIPMTIMITKESTGEMWQKSFTTSTGSACLDLGIFPGEGYIPEVSGLSYTKDEGNVIFTWTGEPGGDFSHVEISYENDDVSMLGTVTIPAGLYTITIPGLPPDRYTFVVKTVFDDTSESIGIRIRISLNLFCVLTVNNNTPEDGAVYIHIGEDWDGQLYTGPVTLPVDLVVYVEPRPFDDYYCWYWDWNPEYNDYINTGNEGNWAEIELADDITIEFSFCSNES